MTLHQYVMLCTYNHMHIEFGAGREELIVLSSVNCKEATTPLQLINNLRLEGD